MDKLLTISVAAYNVERYLDDTLRSLNDPRYLDDIEVLIIDDGSTDGTAAIARRYQEIAPETFHYIAKENGGHGSTINKSIGLATGKYFRVIDGDDWVNEDDFAVYIGRLKKVDADLIVTSYRKHRDGSEKTVRHVSGLIDGKVYTWDDVTGMSLIWMSNLTIRTQLLQSHHVHITEKCYYVDMEYVIWCVYLAGNVLYMDLPTYVYRITGSQSTAKKNMLRNVRMQETVANSMVSLYEQFSGSGGLSGMHRTLVFRPVMQSFGGLYRTYLLMDDTKEIRHKIIGFEQQLRTTSETVYRELGEHAFFRTLRLGNYALLPELRLAYKVWVKVRHSG